MSREFAGMSRTPGVFQKVCAKKVRAHLSFPRITNLIVILAHISLKKSFFPRVLKDGKSLISSEKELSGHH